LVYATEARKAIVAFLRREQRYVDARAILAHLRVDAPKVALSTVYRTLDLLSELGTVDRRSVETGRTEYLYCGDTHHHHAVCRSCGRVDDVACLAMDGVRRELLDSLSFVLDDHDITFYGRCAACKPEDRGEPARPAREIRR